MSRCMRWAGIAVVATLITSATAATKFAALGDACSLLSKADAAAALGEAVSGSQGNWSHDRWDRRHRVGV
jgi:hypothetical protein